MHQSNGKCMETERVGDELNVILENRDERFADIKVCWGLRLAGYLPEFSFA